MHFCKYLIILLATSFPATLFAQPASSADRDITGLWKGTLYNDSTQKYYRYEIGISEEKGKLSGFSHTFFLDGDKEFYGVKKVKVKKADGKIIIEDAGLIANNYPVAPAKGVRQLNVLTLEIKDSIMTLSGPFSTNRTKEYSSLTGTVSLQRKNDFWQSALVPHLQELGLSNDLSFVRKENERIEEEEAKKEAEKNLASNKTPADLQKQTPGNKNEITARKDQPAATTDQQVIANPGTKEDVAKNVVEPEKQSPVKKTGAKTNEPVSTTAKEGSKAADEKTATAKNEASVSKEPPAKEANETSKEIAAKQSTVKKEATEIVTTKTKQPAAEVEKRTTVLQQTVFFSSDSLQISLYDNGEVDGDTVSVLMNGKVIMAKEGLSTHAVRKTIFADPSSDSIELVMYAENLGSIPPNTGLLVVHDGKSIYEIRFSGDLQKNASIILRRKKN